MKLEVEHLDTCRMVHWSASANEVLCQEHIEQVLGKRSSLRHTHGKWSSPQKWIQSPHALSRSSRRKYDSRSWFLHHVVEVLEEDDPTEVGSEREVASSEVLGSSILHSAWNQTASSWLKTPGKKRSLPSPTRAWRKCHEAAGATPSYATTSHKFANSGVRFSNH